MDIKTNTFSLHELVYFQFNCKLDEINDFWKVLYNVLNKTNGRKNSIWIHSQRMAGKNYFVDAVCDSMLLVGNIKNPIRSYIYGFKNGVDKRVLF